MTDPAAYCSHCGRARSCSMHTRAEFPPDAAKAWLKRNCSTPGLCELRYRACDHCFYGRDPLTREILRLRALAGLPATLSPETTP